jgi:glyoxylase-like metal-dependent hydrolase (beta-lactamase superfamily II)
MIDLPSTMRFIERDWLSANNIIFFDGDDASMIDTGYSKHKELTARLVAATIGNRQLRRIINTHLHSDHCGANALLQSRYQCQVLVASASFDDVNQWDQSALTYRGTGQHCDRFTATGAITPGDTFTAGGLSWQAIAAPGHDAKSLVFFAPNPRILISADALWANGFGILFPEISNESGVDEQHAILNVIEALQPAIIIPGHGPMFADLSGALDRARSRLKALGRDRPKHARSALNALMKFLMLDKEVVELKQLPDLLRDAEVMQQAAGILDMPAMSAIEQAYQHLVLHGHLRLSEDGTRLYNQ